MRQRIALSEIVRTGVRMEVDEAVAVAQQIIAASAGDAVEPGPYPPSLDNVWIDWNGLVYYTSETSRSVTEIGALLEAMLPAGGPTRVPGALRFAIARALISVVAPPFNSIAEFAETLKRFEQGDRSIAVRRLFQRAVTGDGRTVPVTPPAQFPERRHRGPSVAALRHQLRDADEERYRLRTEPTVVARPGDAILPDLLKVPGGDDGATRDLVGAWPLDRAPAAGTDSNLPIATFRARVRHSRRRAAALAAAAVVVAFVLGYVGVSYRRGDATPVSQSSSRPDPVPDSMSGTSPATSGVVANDGHAVARDSPPPGHERSIARVLPKSAGTEFSPSFARSDGRWLLFFHTRRTDGAGSALRTADVSSGEPRITTIIDNGARNYHVKLSPAGDRIAFDSDRDGERGVYVANRNGTGAQRVSGSGYAAVPAWSPDGRRLAYVRAESARSRVWNLWLLELESGESRRLTNFRFGQTWTASWFPTGNRICYTHEDRLYILNLVTGSTRAFESPVKGRPVRTPAVSPDGTRVIFQVMRRGAWLLDVRRGTMTQVLDDATAEEFAWGPDGRVAFHSRRDGQWGIWVMIPT